MHRGKKEVQGLKSIGENYAMCLWHSRPQRQVERIAARSCCRRWEGDGGCCLTRWMQEQASLRGGLQGEICNPCQRDRESSNQKEWQWQNTVCHGERSVKNVSILFPDLLYCPSPASCLFLIRPSDSRLSLKDEYTHKKTWFFWLDFLYCPLFLVCFWLALQTRVSWVWRKNTQIQKNMHVFVFVCLSFDSTDKSEVRVKDRQEHWETEWE